MPSHTISASQARLTRSQMARGFKIGGRQFGHRWFEDPAKGGDPPAGDLKPEAKPEAKPDPKEGEPLGEAGKAALEAERTARKAAEKELKRLQDAQTAADEEKRKADDAEAAKRGEFETLAATREKERDDAKADATRLTGEVDQYKAAMKAGIDAGWKELPEAVRKIGEKQHSEDDVLGRWTFLHDPDTAALVKELTGKAETRRGNGGDPKGSGDGTVPDADKQKAQAPLYKRF